MNYQALYRKYRPQNLNEVYGQQVAVNILKNAILKKHFSHAYLFTGSRGSGKTSVAKIVARMVNCENLTDGMPCGECEGCKNSVSNSCVDILEIDAASNNGVDEIRELKSKVNLIPSLLKYKVYIIDEVHMLTDSAFNALLKTLEEPPEHAIFILATTELHKVPTTIISRCQTIEFKKINNADMLARLKEISQKENIKITDQALMEIVNVSDGGLRDAIGMLDMASSYSNDTITDEDIYVINGNVSISEIENLTNLILKRDLNSCIKLINEYSDSGKDLVKILEKIIYDLKDKMLEEKDKNICSILEILIDTINKMKFSVISKVLFEVAIFKICYLDGKKDENELQNDKKVIADAAPVETTKDEKSIQTVEKPIDTDTHDVKEINDNSTLKNARVNNTFVDANKQTLVEIKNKWQKLNDYTFDREYGASVCELLDAVPLAASNTHLILGFSYESFVEKGNMYLKKYEDALRKTINLDVKLIFVSSTEWQKIKKEYIENLKNNVKYSYIEEQETALDNDEEKSKLVSLSDNDMLNKANELFDMSKIEIKENM